MNKPKSVKIETPIGSIESDSGNHLLDIGSVIFVIAFYLILKRIFYKN